MTSIDFKLNNLTIVVSGTGGFIENITYTNLDPVDYVFKIMHVHSKRMAIVTCHASTTEPTKIEGFFRTATDETYVTFLGAKLPD